MRPLSASSAIVSMRAACIYQANFSVLRNVSFDLHKGEFVYLVGRTGSGKSSLLKVLYGDLFLSMGKARVAGYALNTLTSRQQPFLRRQLGIIFQDFQLLYDRTVASNLLFVLQATGWTKDATIKKRIAEVLMQVGLGSMDNKMRHQLSGGEQQRLAIARALLNEPVVLLADEPTGNLDPEVSYEILQLFIEINNTGTAILMATHHHDFIKKHPARTLFCQGGVLRDSDSEALEISQGFTIPVTSPKK